MATPPKAYHAPPPAAASSKATIASRRQRQRDFFVSVKECSAEAVVRGSPLGYYAASAAATHGARSGGPPIFAAFAASSLMHINRKTPRRRTMPRRSPRKLVAVVHGLADARRALAAARAAGVGATLVSPPSAAAYLG